MKALQDRLIDWFLDTLRWHLMANPIKVTERMEGNARADKSLRYALHFISDALDHGDIPDAQRRALHDCLRMIDRIKQALPD